MKLVKKNLDVCVEEICAERCRFVFILDKRVSAVNVVEDVLLRRNVEPYAIKIRGAKSPFR